MDIFKNVPVDPDTTIKSSHSTIIEGLNTLQQKWVWDGIIAESLIFVESEVQDLSDDELIAIAVKNGFMQHDSKFTLTRGSSGYTFLNYNFENPI